MLLKTAIIKDFSIYFFYNIDNVFLYGKTKIRVIQPIACPCFQMYVSSSDNIYSLSSSEFFHASLNNMVKIC